MAICQRPRDTLSPEEKAAIRREKVRMNVRAHRQRQKQRQEAALSNLGSPKKPALEWIPEKTWESRCKAHSSKPHAYEEENDPSSLNRLCLLRDPDLDTQHTVALISLFRSKFLPSHVTLSTSTLTMEQLSTPCAAWVLRAFDLAFQKEKTTIAKILRSTSLGLIAMENGREDLRFKVMSSYRDSLADVRRHLADIKGGKLQPARFTALILACHVAAMYEMAIQASLADMHHHVNGIGALILNQVSVDNQVSESFYSLIEDFRLIEMCFCLTTRRRSMLLGIKDRIVLVDPHGDELSPTDKSFCHVGALMDIADRICMAMTTLDELPSLMDVKPPIQILIHITESASHVVSDSSAWSRKFLRVHGSFVNDPDSTYASDNYALVRLSVSSTWTYSLAYKLYILDVMISAISQLLRTYKVGEAFTYTHVDSDSTMRRSSINIDTLYEAQEDMLSTARLLLQSLPWFYTSEIGITGRSLSMLPLESVRRAFANDIWQTPHMQNSRLGCNPMVMTKLTPKLSTEDVAAFEKLVAKAKDCGLPTMA